MTAPLANTYWVSQNQLLAGEYPGAATRSTAATKLEILLDAGLTYFIDLTTEDDPLEPYEDLLRELALSRRANVVYARRPINDLGCPTFAEMRAILDEIDAAVWGGHRVYVHCWGGVGRTGTVVGCHLVRSGAKGDEALTRVSQLFRTMSPPKVAAHPRSPETEAQRAFVRSWKANDHRKTRAHYRGCLLGGAVGDALGAPVEFLSRDAILAKYGRDGITRFDQAYGRVGAVTDDTQMTLFTAEGVLRAYTRGNEKGICHAPSIVYGAYLRWLSTQGVTSRERVSLDGWLIEAPDLHAARAPGNTCLAALQAGVMGEIERPINNSKGCGAVMRAAPIGLAAPDEPFQLGCEIGALTHGHPSGYLASGALAHIIALLADGRTLSDSIASTLETLRRERRNDECIASLEQALELSRGKSDTAGAIKRLGQGWVAEEALGIAVYCALVGEDDLRRGVILAVNHDGDSDSTGAITGNILGLILGEQAIPAEWLSELELRREIESIADDLLVRYREGEDWWRRYPGW